MFNYGDKVVVTNDLRLMSGKSINKGTQGTFIDYRYGMTIDGEFYPYDIPLCVITLDEEVDQYVCRLEDLQMLSE